jgi:ABC-type transport system involved in multi-copper enzyme maturation permease subunit
MTNLRILSAPGVLIRRELSAMARRRRMYLARAALLGVLMLVFVSAWDRWRDGTSQALAASARSLMSSVYVCLYLGLVFVMPAVMGGVIAGEREAGRLDLLRMMPLTAFQLVAEKFLSRFLYALQWVALCAPFFLSPLFLGGVTPAELAVAVLFPVWAALWTGAVGLLFSALTRRAVTAALATYLFAIVWNLPGLLVTCELFRLTPDEASHYFHLFGYFWLPLRHQFRVPEEFTWQLPLETAGIAVLCLAGAASRLGWEAAAGSAAALRADIGKRRSAVWANPLAWKEVAMGFGSGVRRTMVAGLAVYAGAYFAVLAGNRQGGPRGVLWTVAGVIALAGLLGAYLPKARKFFWSLSAVTLAIGIMIPFVATTGSRPVEQESVEVFSAILILFLCLVAASSSGHGVAHERASMTFEGLLITPLTARAIVDGKALGCWWGLVPGLALLALELVLLPACFRFRALGSCLVGATFLSWILVTVQFGLWMSSRARTPARAGAATIGLILAYVAAVPLLVLLVTRGGGDWAAWINPGYWINMGYAWGQFLQREYPWEGDSYESYLKREAPIAGFIAFWVVCVVAAWGFRRLAVLRVEKAA